MYAYTHQQPTNFLLESGIVEGAMHQTQLFLRHHNQCNSNLHHNRQ